MPVGVELIDEAVQDLHRYTHSGNLPLFLQKLVRLEQMGRDAGEPLGKNLAGWRKIVVGDRNWRIVFTTDPENTVATVWVIGDREDARCYQDAQQRIRALGRRSPEASSLAAVLSNLITMRQSKGRARRRLP